MKLPDKLEFTILSFIIAQEQPEENCFLDILRRIGDIVEKWVLPLILDLCYNPYVSISLQNRWKNRTILHGFT